MQLFKELAAYLQSLEQTTSRNQLTELIAEYLPQLAEEEVAPAMYLMQGRLVPKFVDLEFNFSRKLALKALQELTDLDIQTEFAELGDVGLVAEKVSTQVGKDKAPTLLQVYAELRELAQLEGKGSQEAKTQKFKDILTSSDGLSARYLSRVIIGNLRLGVSDKTVLDALSWLISGDKSLRESIERAYGAKADIGELAKLVVQTKQEAAEDMAAALTDKLQQLQITPGVPVAAKLVEREKDTVKTFERLGECLVQPKLDGMRAQLHFRRATAEQPELFEVFSRNMESLTHMFPDLAAAIRKLNVDSLIIDTEIIGYDFENDTYLPFQETMQRRRKHNVEATAAGIKVKAMAFDVLYLNAEDISQQSLQERVAQLQDLLQEDELTETDSSKIELLDTQVMKSAAELQDYFQDKISLGLEGVIAKDLQSAYDPGTRNFDWIKLKANTQSELVDTIDVVVMGYYIGRGNRAQFGIGALLTAVYDEQTDKFYSVAKVGSGFTEEQLQTISTTLQQLETEQADERYVVTKQLHPDVWVQPEIVMEVIADEITRSPAHTAAREVTASFEKETKERGLSLRFPRLQVWDRDKDPEQATSVSELLRLYELRKGDRF